MLSYRHAFHAGNHADVLKHWVMVLCLQYMKHKDKPFLYLDSHSGAGVYSLSDRHTQKTSEYQQGIGRLWNAKHLPAEFEDYLGTVRQVNDGDALTTYPGSAAIAAHLLRNNDRLCLVEMHRSDHEILKANFSGDNRLRIVEGDGFQQIRAVLPPTTRRGLVLIDPPYELNEDYTRVVGALRDGLKRFATGMYLIWYPLLNTPYSQRIATQLKSVPDIRQCLNVQLIVKAKPPGSGMYGSGMFVVNPPYTLHDQLKRGLPWLVDQLACDDQGCFLLESFPETQSR